LRGAGEAEILDAYRWLTTVYSAKLGRDPEAPARLGEIQEAYAVLSSPQARARYDAARGAAGRLSRRKPSGRRRGWKIRVGLLVALMSGFYAMIHPLSLPALVILLILFAPLVLLLLLIAFLDSIPLDNSSMGIPIRAMILLGILALGTVVVGTVFGIPAAIVVALPGTPVVLLVVVRWLRISRR